MKEKTLRVYSHDSHGYNPKFRDLTLAQIQRDYYYIMDFNDEYIPFKTYVSDEALAEFINNVQNSIFSGIVTSYDVNTELEELDWR